MLTVNNDCTAFRYSGGGILTDTDLSDVTSYDINLTHNDYTYSQSVGVNINVEDDTLSLPCGVTQDEDCTGVLECSPVTEDVYGDTITNFTEPTIRGGGWINGRNEVFLTTIEGIPNSSFESIDIDGNTLFVSASNLLYSNDYNNLNTGDTPSGNIRKLEIDLQDVMMGLGYECIVRLTFNVEKNTTIYEFQFLQSPTDIATTDIRICEYEFASQTTQCTNITRSNSIINYNRYRFYLVVDNYDSSNTAAVEWEMSDEGVSVETLYSNDKYIFFTRHTGYPNVHVARYKVRTLQGQFISYSYGIQQFVSTTPPVGLQLFVSFVSAKDENNDPTVQIFTEYGTGEIIDTIITDCVPSPTDNYTCFPYWNITKEFFYCGTTGQFADGMYHLEIKINYEDGTCKVYKECIFVGCITKCRMIEVLAENKHRIDLVALYQSLILGVNCNLSCDELEEIYDYLTGQLDAISITNGNGDTTNHCGCV